MGFLKVIAACMVTSRKKRDGGSGLREEEEEQEARCGSGVFFRQKYCPLFPFFVQACSVNNTGSLISYFIL